MSIKLGLEQASLVRSLKRVGIATVSGKTGDEQATKIMVRAKKGSTKLELMGTDRTVMVRSQLSISEAPKEDIEFGTSMASLQHLAASLDAGPLTFEYDKDSEYLRFKGGGAKINLQTLPTTNFKNFDEELTKAKKVGEFGTRDMAAGLDYAALFLAWSDDKDSKNPDSQILWVKSSEFVAGPGKVLGVYRCPKIPVEFKTYLTGVQAFQKYLRELTSEKCELYQFDEVFYFVKPKDEQGEILMFSQSPRNPPMDASPGEVLEIFKSEEVFKIDRDSLYRAISTVKVVLVDSQIVTFRLLGKGNQGKLTILGEDNKHEKSEVQVEVVRGTPTGAMEPPPTVTVAEGEVNTERPVGGPQVALDTSKVLPDREFKINYTLLTSLIKLNSNSVLTVGVCPGVNALNIIESGESYSFNALLGFVQS